MTKSGGAIRQSPTPQKANHHPRKTRFFSFVFPSFLLLAFFVVCLLLALCDQIPSLSTLLLGCYWSWALPGLCSTVVVVVVVVVVAVVVIVAVVVVVLSLLLSFCCAPTPDCQSPPWTASAWCLMEMTISRG